MTTQLPTRRLALAALAAGALAATGAARAEPAPGFTATDADGRPVSLAALRGKTVVMEWTNSGCPYVGKHYGSGNMQALQKAARADGVVWLTVMSSAPGRQGALSPAEAKAWMAKEGGAPAHILLDPSGRLGRLYGAKTTPDMRVITLAGALAYQGAIDDRPSTDPRDVPSARNYVRAALADLKAGRPVATAYAKPYGCSVKYAG